MNKIYKSALGKTIYRQLNGQVNASIFYLSGHRNTLDHHKGNLIEACCLENNIGMTRFAYFGWDGSLLDAVPENGEGYTNEWLAQALDFFDNTTEGPQILVGYSMGGYLQLALAAMRPERVVGMIGVAAGFGTNLCERIKNHYGHYRIESEECGFDFSIKQDNSIAILNELPITCPIRLQHAQDDITVNACNTKHIVRAVSSKDVVIHLDKQGGHRLDDPENEAWLCQAIKDLAL